MRQSSAYISFCAIAVNGGRTVKATRVGGDVLDRLDVGEVEAAEVAEVAIRVVSGKSVWVFRPYDLRF